MHNELLNQHFVRDRGVPANIKQTKVVPLPDAEGAGNGGTEDGAAASDLVLQDISDDESGNGGPPCVPAAHASLAAPV